MFPSSLGECDFEYTILKCKTYYPISTCQLSVQHICVSNTALVKIFTAYNFRSQLAISVIVEYNNCYFQ